MAAPGFLDVVKKELQGNVCACLVQLGFTNSQDVRFLKISRDLKNGDIIIPAGYMNLDELKTVQLKSQLDKVNATQENSIWKATKNKSSLLAFSLNRPQFCQNVIREIQSEGYRYGHAKTKVGHSVFVNSVCSRNTTNDTSLTDLRIHVLGCHIENLLEANGFSVVSQSKHRENLHKLIHSQTESTNECSQQSHSIDKSKIEQMFVTKAQQLAVDSCLDTENLNTEKDLNNLVLDLRKIIEDNNFYTGSGGFDRNLNKVFVVQDGKTTDVLKEAISLSGCLQSKQCTHCVHVVPHHQAFRQQQVQLILTALSSEKFHQSVHVVGPVTHKQDVPAGSRGSTSISLALYKSRYLQMKEASESRNAGQSSDIQVQLLTSASIKLDLLGNTSHTSFCIDVESADRGAESRLGAFVLYNSARLATLMSHFTQGVQQGLYPPLPPVEEIDYSLLREEEDWELVFLYLSAFPDVVHQSVQIVFPTDGKNLARIHTQKVTSFIVSFTKCLSSYYSRYHVLTGGQAHLLPLMYARLYVLKSTHQVLINCLQLVGVESLSFL